MDRRLTAFNGRVADEALRGSVDAEHFVYPQRKQLVCSAWLLSQPDGRRDRQALFGDAFNVIETRGEQVFGQLEKDGYVGWIPSDALGPHAPATHSVSVRTTWGWREPDFKAPAEVDLHMSSRVSVTAFEDTWAVLGDGELYVPRKHLMPLDAALDPVDAARAFLGTPYIWAGNSGFGIDCSGLVQVSYHAAGKLCPPDSDLQALAAGRDLAPDEPLQAGDLIFWKGHVAMVTIPDRLIHANAHHMAVVEEPLGEAVERIARTETGRVTRRLRPAFSNRS